MKTVEIESTSLSACVADARDNQIVLTEKGRPVAVLYGLQGLDEEQLALCGNGEFWRMLTSRRQEPLVSREELEQMLSAG